MEENKVATALKAAEQKASGLSRKLHELYEEEARLERETNQAWAEVERLEALHD
jgi:predicted  nucleic acid-binding Zn-ribbon protein